MLQLIKIDLHKMFNYRTFWVIGGLYFFTLAVTTASGMEFLKWLASKGAEFGTNININRIPLYHFPDIWQNLFWISGLLKIVLGIMVVISITNEYTYRTIRQNIIDGLSRWQFLQTKIFTNLILSLTSVSLVFSIALVTGFIYSPEINLAEVFTDMEFVPAYFLEVFAFLSYALMLGMVIQRSGLTIVVLMLSAMMEGIIRLNLPELAEPLKQFFPMASISNLVSVPFGKYALQEIQDDVSLVAVAIALLWTFMFNYFSYLKLKHADI